MSSSAPTTAHRLGHSYGNVHRIAMRQELETRPWDIGDYLQTEEDRLAYLEAALEDGDPTLIAAALDDIARSSSPNS
mgnify:CR=1 FL=1